ncbi:MAG: hypothetical protein PHH54_06885 [Candidatus Nanoarchaeia archaeon]|nr:hypothetical protein [Candidatus Nanoarchaeia archaeon]MDD5741680.1 hypothetical protein [Candidatus Nanoarchaeia archaeon]
MTRLNLFKPNLKEASDNCWKCYITDNPNEEKERESYYWGANNSLIQVIKECEIMISENNSDPKTLKEATESKKIAEEAQKRCKGCNYRDTKIKNHLEVYGIRSD